MWPQGSECTVQQECGSFGVFVCLVGWFLFHCCWVFVLFCFYYLCSLNSRSDELKKEGTTWSGQIICSCTTVSLLQACQECKPDISVQSFCSRALAETCVRLNLDVSFLSDIRTLTYFALLLQMDCRKKGRKEKVPLHFLYFGCQILFYFFLIV